MAKQFHRFKQLAGERLAGKEKTDRLTESLFEAEKKMEGIRAGCHVTGKKLHACLQASGSTVEKHQKKLPQYALGNGMADAGRNLGPTVFGNILRLVGQAEVDISSQVADYEMSVETDVIQPLNAILENELKKVDKSKKKLSSARLDMDSIRNRYQSMQDKYSPKAESVKSELDQAISRFELCQDTYAADLFAVLTKEREMAEIIHKLVVCNITRHKQALGILEGILPHIDNEIDQTNNRPVYGFPLDEHLNITGYPISYVIEECCLALREKYLDTEGLFRLAASSSKLKLLKNAFDAGVVDLDGQDPHTIAGALKQYLRELPDSLLTSGLYNDWLKAAGTADENERLQQLWLVKEKLPKSNFQNLRYLMHFLHDFSKYHEETKMNVSNIAIVIGPNLLWPKEETLSGLVGDTAFNQRITECFIKHPDYFFGEAPPQNVRPRQNKLFSPKPTAPKDFPTPATEDVDYSLPSDRRSLTSEMDVAVTTPITKEREEEDKDGEKEREKEGDSPEQTEESPPTQPHTPRTTGEKPTPPVRKRKSIRSTPSRDGTLPKDSGATTPSASPRTPGGRPSRPAPQPPPSRPKPRPPPPQPPTRSKLAYEDNNTDNNHSEETIL